nr:OmpA family protein [Vibrio coralliirubri]
MEKNKRGIVIKFDSASLFESGSAELKDNAFTALRALAAATNHTNLYYHTYGYSDRTPVRRGSDVENNLILSIMRATSATRAILDGGVDSNRVTIHGEGELNPEDSHNTADAYAKNRRVELYMSYSSAPHKIYGESVTYSDLTDASLVNEQSEIY